MTIDADLLDEASAAVSDGDASSVSAWVNQAMADKSEHRQRRHTPPGQHPHRLTATARTVDAVETATRRTPLTSTNTKHPPNSGLIVGTANKTAAATLVERVSRHTLVVPLPDVYTASEAAGVVTDALDRFDDSIQHVLYGDDMPRARHPKKEVEAALAELEDAGWTVAPTASGHRWGIARCVESSRSGCQVSIWSTPRSPGGLWTGATTFLLPEPDSDI